MFFKKLLKFVAKVFVSIASVVFVILPITVANANEVKKNMEYENYIDISPHSVHIEEVDDEIHHFLFNKFIQEHNKDYSLDEYRTRFRIFIENLYKIKNHNDYHNSTYKLGINKFADLSNKEFVNKYLHKYKQSSGCLEENTRDIIFPPSIDWVSSGAVTNVKDQQQCGSCYSFSTTGALEGIYYIKNKKLVSFSEQQLVDCSKKYGNDGCEGGLMVNGFNYIMDNGLCSESDYPYIAKVQSCHSCNIVSGSKIKNCLSLPTNELSLTSTLSQQPVAVAIEADKYVFQFYKSGVITDKCGDNLDHAVLAVGYGHDDKLNVDYYKVKNSWGLSWGENGYVRILRNSVSTSSGMCGIAKMTSIPIM